MGPTQRPKNMRTGNAEFDPSKRNFLINAGRIAGGLVLSGSLLETLSLMGCTNVNVVTLPPIANPIIVDLSEIQDGRQHIGYGVKIGQPFKIQVSSVEAPILQATATDINSWENERSTTIQRNWVTVEGIITRNPAGELQGTAAVAYMMSFETRNNSGTQGGSKFFVATPVKFLGNQLWVSTRPEERNNGEICLGDMPIRGWIGINQEASAKWSDTPPFSVFAKLIGTKNHEDWSGKDYWFATVDLGTYRQGERHSISQMEAMPADVTENIKFPEGSWEQKAGIYNMHYQAEKIGANDALIDLVVNSSKIYPYMDSVAIWRFGDGVSVSKDQDGNYLRSLTFSVNLTGMASRREVLPFSTDKFAVWLMSSSSKPDEAVFVFSSK